MRKKILILSFIFAMFFISNTFFAEEPFLENITFTNYISKKKDIYKILQNGDISKNGVVRYKFNGSISTNQAFYKFGIFWAGVQRKNNLLEIFPSFSGKKGVTFNKKPIATLTNQ